MRDRPVRGHGTGGSHPGPPDRGHAEGVVAQPAGGFLTDFPGLGDALAWLDSHQNMERMLASGPSERAPDLGRMRALVDALGHPERTCPVVHVTGTNGKTSTARCLAGLLGGRGLRVGTFTSPHLSSLNERLCADGEPIDDTDLVAVLGELAAVEELLDVRLTWFELLTGAAMMWFADRPVDVAVFEVGMGGRWDATNVVDAAVAVVTNVGLDHVEFLGPTRADVAGEKAGIVTPGCTLVLGERDPDLLPLFEREGPAQLWRAGPEWDCSRNDLAVGGRDLDLRTPAATYEDVFLDLHGAHQGFNFATALAATEAFFGAPVPDQVVRRVAAGVSSPGRMEVLGRDPLVVLDGAKNLEGAAVAAASLAEEFGTDRPLTLVVGMLRGAGKEPVAMLEALGAARASLVVACPAPSPRTQPAEEVAAAAASLGCEAVAVDTVAAALERALAATPPDGVVFVTGSLYVVGAARSALVVV